MAITGDGTDVRRSTPTQFFADARGRVRWRPNRPWRRSPGERQLELVTADDPGAGWRPQSLSFAAGGHDTVPAVDRGTLLQGCERYRGRSAGCIDDRPRRSADLRSRAAVRPLAAG